MPALSSLVAPEVVITTTSGSRKTTSGATSDDQVDIMTTPGVLWSV